MTQLPGDQFGYWQVAGRRYYNKLQAAVDAVSMGHWIHWNFNESVFSTYDWSVEPVYSLDYYYTERARQLRRNYDYIAMEYSGGADSWNMLYYFVKNGLRVDNVIYRHAGEVVKDATELDGSNQWGEGKYQAWPSFQKLLQLDPTMQWNTWNIVEPILDAWSDNTDSIFDRNNWQPGSVIKTPGDTDTNPFGIPDLPSTGMVYGIDKPTILFENGGFYLTFYDHPIIGRSVIDRKLRNVGMSDELFYWNPECMDMLCKQAHLVVRHLKQHPELIPVLKDRNEYFKIVNQIIYPDYDFIWQSNKPIGLHTCSSDQWFIDYGQSASVDNWTKRMLEMSDLVTSMTRGTEFAAYTNREPNDDRFTVLASCPSKKYFIAALDS